MYNSAGAPAIEGLLRALADPTRRELFERLASTEASIARLTEQLPISQSAISQHMAVLRSAGLVHQRKQGRSTIYRADPDGLAPLVDWIARQERFWRNGLDRLDTFLSEIDDDGCQ